MLTTRQQPPSIAQSCDSGNTSCTEDGVERHDQHTRHPKPSASLHGAQGFSPHPSHRHQIVPHVIKQNKERRPGQNQNHRALAPMSILPAPGRVIKQKPTKRSLVTPRLDPRLHSSPKDSRHQRPRAIGIRQSSLLEKAVDETGSSTGRVRRGRPSERVACARCKIHKKKVST